MVTSYAQEFISLEHEMRTIDFTINIYREKLEKWIPSLKGDNTNKYVAPRNEVRGQENRNVSQVSI